jgi:hypothetical protein
MIDSEIVAKAIALINAPRDWGRSFNQSLSEIVGQAIVKATQSAPLASADFERLRIDVLKTLRTPKTT